MKPAHLFFAAAAISLFGASSTLAASIAQWEPANTGTAIPSTADHSFVTSSAWLAYSNGSVYFTGDAGAATPAWMRMDKGSNRGQPFDMGFTKAVTAIASADSNDDYKAFVAMHSDKYYSQLYRCTYARGSISWKDLSGAGFTNIQGVSVNPIARARVYVASPNGVRYSADNGDTWQASAVGDPLTPPSGAAVSAVSASHLNQADWIVVGTTTGEVWLVFGIRSGAGSWVRLDAGQAANMPNQVVTRVQLDDHLNPPAILAVFGGTNTLSTWLSMNGGQSFFTAKNPVIGGYAPQVLSMSLSPNAGDSTLYGQLLGYGAVRSDDNGQTWSRLPR